MVQKINNSFNIYQRSVNQSQHTGILNSPSIFPLEKNSQISQSIGDININALCEGRINKPSITIGGVTHYHYDDYNELFESGAVDKQLVTIDNRYLTTDKKGQKIEIREEAYKAFIEMANAALNERPPIRLTIASAYRGKQYQIGTFNKFYKSNDSRYKGLDRREYASKRAKVSAPPGFSEHHTGLAIDLCSVSPRDFRPGGKYYREGQWLQQHAAEYGFEQSFPHGNAQGVDQEDWHWRYVGKNGEFKEIFREARSHDDRYKDEFQQT